MQRPELEFLPATGEIERTPPWLAARGLLWAIFVFCLLAGVWAGLGEVDIVSVAEGRILPAARVKRIQSAYTGTVRAVHVAEGQAVRAGARLIELDDTQARAELARLEEERRSVAWDRYRLLALLERLDADDGRPTAIASIDAAPAAVQARIEGEFHAFDAERLGTLEEGRRCAAEVAAIGAEIGRLDGTLPLLTERVAALRDLAARSLVPRVSWLELEEDRVARTHERAVLEARRRVAAAGCVQVERRLTAQLARQEADWRAQLAAAETRLASYAQEIRKAANRVAAHTLRAPVDGRIQELAVNTVGGVVTPAEPLMVIVPANGVLLVEAMIPNKDIGFVAVGQRVVIKIETFPFTHYGTVPGTLINLSSDAVVDSEKGLVYLAQVALGKTSVQVGDKRAALASGMAVRVEIDLGRRRVLDYLLAPLMRYRDESLTER
ncbi:MAG: HlyD family type I secretion periplasmic adaptor subunit [Gammaproteobacteria bacterium]